MRVTAGEQRDSEYEDDVAVRSERSGSSFGRLVTVVRSPWFPWAMVGLVTVAVAITWWPTFWLPFGDGRDGGLNGSMALRVRNFWEQGLLGSDLVSDTSPYTSRYAHHPPVTNFLQVLSSAFFGQGEWQARVVPYTLGLSSIPAGALLLRQLHIRWIAVFVALGTMIATEFFWVYGRLLGGFAPILLLGAAIAHLRQQEEPPNWKVWGIAGLAALTVAYSWPAAGAAAGFGLWLLAGRGFDRATIIVGSVMSVSAAATLWWVVGLSGIGNIVGQTEFRTTGGGFGWGEFFARQRGFVTALLPDWYLVLLPVGLIAGLSYTKTRIVTLVTLAVVVAWGIGLRNGAYIHDYWNYGILAPGLVGVAGLVDLILGRSARWLNVAGGALVGVLLLSAFVDVSRGPAEHRYFLAGSSAGAVLRDQTPPPEQSKAWVVGGLSSRPRWLSWYWDLPTRSMDPETLREVGEDQLVLLRLDRLPAWVGPGVEEILIRREGRYGLATVGDLESVVQMTAEGAR